MGKTKVMEFTGTALKNLFSKPVTTKYPAEPAVYPERSRGHIEIDIDQCISCGMCQRCCPPGALKVSMPEGTWTINRFDCVQCGYCVQKCPKKCLRLVPGYQEPEPQKSEETFRISEEVMKQRAEAKAKAVAAAKARAAAMAAKKAEAAKKAADATTAEAKPEEKKPGQSEKPAQPGRPEK